MAVVDGWMEQGYAKSSQHSCRMAATWVIHTVGCCAQVAKRRDAVSGPPGALAICDSL